MKTTPGIFAGLALSMLLAVPALAQNKVTIYTAAPQDLVDRVIPEPAGGAHSDPEAAILAAGDAIEEELKLLLPLSPDALRAQRAARFEAIGRVAGI